MNVYGPIIDDNCRCDISSTLIVYCDKWLFGIRIKVVLKSPKYDWQVEIRKSWRITSNKFLLLTVRKILKNKILQGYFCSMIPRVWNPYLEIFITAWLWICQFNFCYFAIENNDEFIFVKSCDQSLSDLYMSEFWCRYISKIMTYFCMSWWLCSYFLT